MIRSSEDVAVPRLTQGADRTGFSPNGDWLAYASDETGSFECASAPQEGGRLQRVSAAANAPLPVPQAVLPG